MRTRLFVVVLFLEMLAYPVHAADRYVAHNDQTPDPAGEYTDWSIAASNIQDAVNAAAEGETIWVAPSRYTIPPNATNYIGSNVVYINKPVTLRSSNGVPATTVIDGEATNRGIGIFFTAHTTIPFVIDGFTISNCFATNMGGGILFNSDNLRRGTAVVHNCVIADNRVGWGYNAGSFRDSAGARGGGLGQYSWNLRSMGVFISNCVFRGNVAMQGPVAANGGSGGGLHAEGFSVVRIFDSLFEENVADVGGAIRNVWPSLQMERCTVRNNVADGKGSIEFGGGGIGGQLGATGGDHPNWIRNSLFHGNSGYYSGAITIQRGPPVAIYNCTIVSNTAGSTIYSGGIRLRFTSQRAGLRVWNTTIQSNTPLDLQLDSYTNAFFTNCCIGVTNDLLGANNFTNDPSFVDFANRNFQLKSGSPCINTGTNQDWMIGHIDLLGNPRIDWGTVDVGCFEHVTYGTIVTIQ